MSSTPFHRNAQVSILITFFLLSLTHYPGLAQSIGVEPKGYSKASYSVSQAGVFMKNWLVAGPVPVVSESTQPDMALQEKVFKTDMISQVNIKAGIPVPPLSISKDKFKWQLISSKTDIINLDPFFKEKNFVYAYAVAEIKASAPSNAILAIGSDDGIRVWLNGKLVHDNWIPRGTSKDEDLVPLKLVKGSNQLLLKVQDINQGWSFVARLLDKQALSKHLYNAAGKGSLDEIKFLVEGGAHINAANEMGMTPIVAAKLEGREETVQMLLKMGAVDKPVPTGEALTDSLYSSLNRKESPGIAVLVAKDGNVLYKKGFGYADIKNKIPVTPDTKFRIGSVTKQFTAAAILKLQENNLLNVNDKLSKYIPDFPRGNEVTIHQLLTHTSGIRSYTSKPDFINKVTNTITPDSLIRSFKNDPYDFTPGERMLYNNSGYFLLGSIIAMVSGKPYDIYLKETFFDPLRMDNTGIHYAGIKLTNEARGYGKKGNGYDDALNWDMSWAGGAGAMYSTLDDLLKWNQALYGGRVLKKESLDAALTSVVLKNGELPIIPYGYGLGLNKYRGKNMISHGGGLHGFVTQLAYYPDEKLTVVMFSNTNEPEVNFDHNKIIDAFCWDKMGKQISYGEASVKPVNLEAFVGRYDLPNIGVLTVSTENNRLYSQMSGQQKFEIFPMSENEFFWKVVEARIKFIRDEKGQVNSSILYQYGGELKAKKMEEELIIKLDPALLDSYTGKYRLNEEMVVTILREGDKLFAWPTNQPKIEMHPVAEARFVIKEINAKLLFIKDENGKVSKIQLNMNGGDSELTKLKEN